MRFFHNLTELSNAPIGLKIAARRVRNLEFMCIDIRNFCAT